VETTGNFIKYNSEKGPFSGKLMKKNLKVNEKKAIRKEECENFIKK